MRKNWPPNKAWTSTKLIVGYRHFVAINYGGKSRNRWVQLVSVLDGRARLKLAWKVYEGTQLDVLTVIYEGEADAECTRFG